MTMQLFPLLISLLIVILAFNFPAKLIDALKLEDGEKAREARTNACACFGFMMLLLVWLILGLN